jgi:hypothetical protein
VPVLHSNIETILSTQEPLMPALHDSELEHFKRTIDLFEYAKKTGYEVRAVDIPKEVVLLQHPNRDRIVVAQRPNGAWIYASVTDYAPRSAAESPESAARRLRDCIERARDKGSIVEFVQMRDWTARRGEVPLERVRERLRTYRDSGLPLDFEGPLNPPRIDPRELNQRRSDRTPAPIAPHETDVERRLRRWDAAERSLVEHRSQRTDRRACQTEAAAAARTLEVPRAPRDRRARPERERTEVGRRRYDGPPPLDVAAAIARRRDRGPERGR